ncbi:SRPBCC family protein [Kutzneria sp. NPDC051319]|uniref:SRPBCC family protein n=1 Tax=Kutzneria sp. NPDC051319 TaxID=3155047 RepID=UPI0034222B33
MTEVSRTVPVSPEHVYAVLSDGWSYAGWVVGNSHIREVDPAWPAVGCRIHHSAGLWPLQFNDWTEVTATVPDRMIELRARLWPLGAAMIRIELTPTGDGTTITMVEHATEGPATLVPASVQGVLLRPRNKEVLGRLSDLARGRARAVQP